MKLNDHGYQIRGWLEEGRSYRYIAKQLGCHHSTVAVFCQIKYPGLRERIISAEKAEREADEMPEVERSLLQILVIDIETRPNLAYVWGVWNQDIHPNQIIDEKDVICFAAKWIGEDEVHFYSVHHDGKSTMVAEAWKLLDQADAVIHYNGKKFDVPHLNLEFKRAGMGPTSPFRQIDLLNTVKREFRFTHNKLDHVASKLGLGNKVEHEGFNLWLKCMAGNDEAWERMREYNINDVLLTEKLYYEILPWITNHPSYAAVQGDRRCPNCGSEDLRSAKFQYTKTGRYPRWRCGNCGKYCRDTHRQSAAKVTETSSW